MFTNVTHAMLNNQIKHHMYAINFLCNATHSTLINSNLDQKYNHNYHFNITYN